MKTLRAPSFVVPAALLLLVSSVQSAVQQDASSVASVAASAAAPAVDTRLDGLADAGCGPAGCVAAGQTRVSFAGSCLLYLPVSTCGVCVARGRERTAVSRVACHIRLIA